VAADNDLLFGEVDRQLAEVRATADGLATRSGLLLAADGVGAAVLAPAIHAGHHQSLLIWTLVALAAAVLTGALSLTPTLKIGPNQAFLARSISRPTARTSAVLYDAKLAVLSANRARVTVITVLLLIQALTTLISLALALTYVAWK
jgi:hypothetical protein